MVCLGSIEMVRVKGDTIFESFGRFGEWEENARIKGFVSVLRDYF